MTFIYCSVISVIIGLIAIGTNLFFKTEKQESIIIDLQDKIDQQDRYITAADMILADLGNRGLLDDLETEQTLQTMRIIKDNIS